MESCRARRAAVIDGFGCDYNYIVGESLAITYRLLSARVANAHDGRRQGVHLGLN
jgi:hypothetical protein